MKTIGVSLLLMAVIYAFIGIFLFLLLNKSEKGVQGNILASIPETHIFNIIISILMVITCIGGYPLYMGPIHEVVEGNWGAMTSNKYFITNKNYIMFRTAEILLISVVAAIFPFFSDLLGFNILRTRKSFVS